MGNIIFTLNSRDNVWLDILKDHGKLNYFDLKTELSRIFLDMQNLLSLKGINYDQLKNALIPSYNSRQEMLFIFDKIKIKNNSYGFEINDYLLSLMDKKSTNSVLCGDYIDIINNPTFLKEILLNEFKIDNYVDNYQFYFIYINNLSKNARLSIESGLKRLDCCIGSIDITFSSVFKDYLSFIVSHRYIKCGKYILVPNHDNFDSNDINSVGYKFEENGFSVKSLHDSYYDLFLSHKIERRLFPKDIDDINYSLCVLTDKVDKLDNFYINVSEAKLTYLKNNKAGIMKRLELLECSADYLEKIIKEKIGKHYIFNLKTSDIDAALTFNVMLEIFIERVNKKFKVLVSLKYVYNDKRLLLVTMY